MSIRTTGKNKKPVKSAADKQSGFSWFDSAVAAGTLFDSFIISASAPAPVEYSRAASGGSYVIQINNNVKSSLTTAVGLVSLAQATNTVTTRSQTVKQAAVLLSASAATGTTPFIPEEFALKGAGKPKVLKVKHAYKTYADKADLDEKIYAIIFGEVKEIAPEKEVKNVTHEIVSSIDKTDFIGKGVLDETLLKELARLQAWLTIEEFKRKAEKEDEEALLWLI